MAVTRVGSIFRPLLVDAGMHVKFHGVDKDGKDVQFSVVLERDGSLAVGAVCNDQLSTEHGSSNKFWVRARRWSSENNRYEPVCLKVKE